ncbi:MAG: hypothetical protein PHH13_04165 [Candidatus Peribacteraceae bacterium]|nr:hypothetical protein [Candidatus Peribacteraceae bacterium]
MTVSDQGLVETELLAQRSVALEDVLQSLGWELTDLALHLAERRGDRSQAPAIQAQLEECVQGTALLPITLCAEVTEQFELPLEKLAVQVTDEERAQLAAREEDDEDDSPTLNDPAPKGAGAKGGKEIPLKVLRGHALDAALKASGMSQSELCRRACGRSGTQDGFRKLQCAVSNYRLGKNLMPEEIIGLLAPVLGVSEETLRVRPADEREGRLAGRLRRSRKTSPPAEKPRRRKKPAASEGKRPYHRRVTNEAAAKPRPKAESMLMRLDHAKFLELFGDEGVEISLKRGKGGVTLTASVTLGYEEFVASLGIPE